MMLSSDPRPAESTLPRARRPAMATREVLFAMATPPIGRSEALWPTWLVPSDATWRRRPTRPHTNDARSE
jgi:hypothetical protein